MIRASSSHRITTNRPFFDGKAFKKLEEEFKKKVEKKGIEYKENNRSFIKEMIETSGLKTIAEKVLDGMEKRHVALTDPLPAGAKTALQELFLEKHYGFINMSINENDPALKKGTLVEDDSIAFLGKSLGLTFFNNKKRVSNAELFLTGEADILHENTVRDVKTPLNWSTFRKKDGIETAYHWQLISYCLLYDKEEAYLDYILMPSPEEMIKDQIKYLTPEAASKIVDYNYKISLLSSVKRIKTYQIPTAQISKDIEFLKRRLIKAKEYYNTLTYDICMKMN